MDATMTTSIPIYRRIIALTLPLMFIQICQASLGLVDTLIAGQYHYKDLAAVGLASNLWSPVAILLTGIMYALVPKFSSAVGNNQWEKVSELFRLGKRNALILSVIGFMLLQTLAFLMPIFIVDPEVAGIAKNYLHAVAFAIPGLTYIVLYRFLNEGHSNMKPIAITGGLLLITNCGLNYILVGGFAGFPPLGGLGCGVATVISTYLALLCLKTLSAKTLHPLKPLMNDPIDAKSAQKLMLEGLPIGIALVLEVLALTALAFMASTLGTKVVAAHQVAINIAMVIFMIPVAISSAATIQVAHFHGKQESNNSRKTALAAMLIAAGYGSVMTLILLLFGHHLTGLFTQDQEVNNLISGLIIFIAMFQLVDALQMVAAGILRGLEEFVKPLLTVLFIYWVVIIPASYLIGVKGWLVSEPRIETIWMMLTLGLTFAAVFLGLQSYRMLNKSKEKIITQDVYQ